LLNLEDTYVSFDASFGGVLFNIYLPINSILSIYSAENGQGLVFDPADNITPPPADQTPKKPKGPSDKKSGPTLKIVK